MRCLASLLVFVQATVDEDAGLLQLQGHPKIQNEVDEVRVQSENARGPNRGRNGHLALLASTATTATITAGQGGNGSRADRQAENRAGRMADQKARDEAKAARQAERMADQNARDEAKAARQAERMADQEARDEAKAARQAERKAMPVATTTMAEPVTTVSSVTSAWIYGEAESNECPAGSWTISDAGTCERASGALALRFDGENSFEYFPKGCLLFDDGVHSAGVFFNSHWRGGGHLRSQPLCETGDTTTTTTTTMTVVTVAGVTLIYGEAESNECPAGSRTISDAGTCEQASVALAREFAGEDSEPDYPKGCYAYQSWAVYFNTNVTGGAGEEMSQPLCVAM